MASSLRSASLNPVDKKVLHPVDAIRDLLLSIERRAISEGATGAVDGAVTGFREQLREADRSFSQLLTELTATLEDAHATARTPGVLPHLAHEVGAAFADGALESLDQRWNHGQLPFRGLEQQVQAVLDRISTLAKARSHEAHSTGRRASLAASGALRGATHTLHETLPQVTADLRGLLPLANELGAQFGSGVVRGIGIGLTPWRKPAVAVASLVGTGFLLLAGGLIWRRR